jgi:DNA-sulfur modification-associated
MSEISQRSELTAIKVRQWLTNWDEIQWEEDKERGRPEEHFYMFTLPALTLRKLSGVYRRDLQTPRRSLDLGIQRRHDPERSEEIKKYIQFGFPWSKLSSSKRESGEFNDFKKPGWLPTAIIVNILGEDDKRRGQTVDNNDHIKINNIDNKTSVIQIPIDLNGQTDWHPKGIPPIEVIDGQHRLWAFGEDELDGSYELPVIAFNSLGLSWQAYLFWTINIKPKRINASLAFDLYPLLRKEDWLDKFEGHPIYRETRAQEIVESLWSYPESPWYHRINMLGESGVGQMVTQAAWVKSLMTTYIKAWEGKRISIGGLFGSPSGSNDEVLPWSRTQQAAFLIYVWQEIKKAVNNCQESWAQSLRGDQQLSIIDNDQDPAFSGSFETHFNTNIGTRGALHITNDLCYIEAESLDLWSWFIDENSYEPTEETIEAALDSLKTHKVADFIHEISINLAKFDWRTSSAPNLSEEERLKKAAIRGGAGFKELRQQLLLHLSRCDSYSVSEAAQKVAKRLGYDS